MIMDSRFLASGLLLLVLLLEPADSGLQPTAANVDAQQAARSPETYVPIDATVYSKLLDAIFPVDIAPSHRVFLIVLRRTGFGPESQVVIRMESDYSVDARWYRVTNGVAHAIADRYWQQTGHEDIRRMASMIKVEERRIAVPRSQAEEWQSTLLEALEDSAAGLKHEVEEDRKDGSERIVLDGTEVRSSSKHPRWSNHYAVLRAEYLVLGPSVVLGPLSAARCKRTKDFGRTTYEAP